MLFDKVNHMEYIVAILLVVNILITINNNRKMSELTDALDGLKAQVESQATVLESAKSLISGLAAKLDVALANSDTTAALAAVKQISDTLKAQDDDLSAAVVANTPAQ